MEASKKLLFVPLPILQMIWISSSSYFLDSIAATPSIASHIQHLYRVVSLLILMYHRLFIHMFTGCFCWICNMHDVSKNADTSHRFDERQLISFLLVFRLDSYDVQRIFRTASLNISPPSIL